MGKHEELKNLTNSIKCLIVFENKTAALYGDIADKTIDLPLVKSLLLTIGHDSEKHSTILKGIVQSLPKTSWKSNELPKAMAEAWRSIDAFQVELSDVEEILTLDLSNLAAELNSLEKIMIEAYDVLMRYGNLELMMDALGSVYNLDLELLKRIFIEVMHDEEHHKEILLTVKELIDQRVLEKKDLSPVVRFQNPDAWNVPATATG